MAVIFVLVVVKHVVMVSRVWHLVWDFFSSEPFLWVVQVLSCNSCVLQVLCWRSGLLRLVVVM